MTKFVYSVVRCFPAPRTGEFVNAAVLVGDPDNGTWVVRRPKSSSHLRKLASEAQRQAVDEFIDGIAVTVSRNYVGQFDTDGGLLGASWLGGLRADHQNLVQFSTPSHLSAPDLESAADLVSGQLLVEPARPKQPDITRRNLQSQLHDRYKAAVSPEFIHTKVSLVVGGRRGQDFDFAIGNGHVVQLAQTISFRVGAIGKVKTEVEALGYNLSRLRRKTDDAYLVNANGDRISTVTNPDVEVAALVALPKSESQKSVYAEARAVLGDLNVHISGPSDAREVSERARVLLAR